MDKFRSKLVTLCVDKYTLVLRNKLTSLLQSL